MDNQYSENDENITEEIPVGVQGTEVVEVPDSVQGTEVVEVPDSVQGTEVVEVSDSVQAAEAEDAYIRAGKILKNQRSKQYSAIAIILAIMAYPCSCGCPILGVILAVVAIVFALLSGNSEGKRNVYAIVAVVISVVAIVTGIAAMAVNLTTVLFDKTFMEEYNAMLEEMQNSMQQTQ